MAFDFRYTCSEINQEIDNAHNGIKDVLVNNFDLLSSILDGSRDRDTVIDEYAKLLHEEVLQSFETVRDLNEEMRDAAEYQTKGLYEDLQSKVDEVEELERQLNEKSAEVEELNDYIATLES